MIKFSIDGKEVVAQKGETILQVARREGIYIPTMCYLSKVKPIESCRLCVVEVEGVEGFVLSCQTPPTPDIKVRTNSAKLFEHRQNIMKLYDVNHPLECGVCDKSGECDLQNKTLEFRVDYQEFTAKDQYRPIQKWQYIQYDPSLCILCEKCVHVCNEVIGDDAIEIEYGGYKSRIVPKNAETLDCTFCGECIAVCPVGALISSDFKYSANAWELSRIPAACAHCSAACHLYYEVKHASITNSEPKIYRVKNEFEFETLCGAGRFGFDFENRAQKDEKAFEAAVEAFKRADTIKFTSYITNEEALILQRLKEKFGYKLINEEARAYQEFLQNYAEYSGRSLPSGDVKAVHKSNFVVSVGTALKSDNPRVRFAFNNAIKMNKGGGIYFHPIKDPIIESLGKTLVPVYHKPLKEEAVLYFILQEFADRSKLPKAIRDYLDSLMETRTKEVEETVKEKVVEIVEEEIVDEKTGKKKKVQKKVTKEVPKKVKKKVEYQVSKLYEMIGAPEDLMDKLKKVLAKKEKAALILGEDLYTHPRAKNIARLAGVIDRFTDFEVMIIPPKTNSLGVALICDLDKEAGEYSIGYNVKGDFTLSALGDGDLDMPALNQQEGTFTNIDKRVVPTNVALPYGGYVLNDIARALGVSDKEYTIEYTKELPKEKGYKEIEFDDLPNEFLNDGSENRGYVLEVQKVNLSRKSVEPIEELPEFNGTVVYRCEPVLQFSPFTNRAHQLTWACDLIGSEQFSVAAKLQDGDRVVIHSRFGEIEKTFRIDPKLKGTIALMGVSDMGSRFFDMQSTYRYERVKITKRVEL